MTVSRVINCEPNVTKKKIDQVMLSIEALDYKPNLSARALAGNRIFKIALLYANPSAFYLSELLVGALEEISHQGHQLLVHKIPQTDSEKKVRNNLSRLVGQYDGVIVPAPLGDYKTVRSFLNEKDIPAIYLSGLEVSGRSLKICIDDYAAVKDVLFKLIALGHTRIGIIKGNPNQHSTNERLRAYIDALKDSGIPYNKDFIASGLYTYESGHRAATQLLTGRNIPTAIFASNDDMAAATMAVAASLGFKVPDDLSVVGFDDSPLASALVPRLTTIKQPISEMAGEAIRRIVTLINLLDADQTANLQPLIMDYEIIFGESISAPR